MANLKVSLENIIPLTEARDHFSQIVTEVQQDKLYVLTKGGKPAVAIIDVKYLESVTGGTVKPEHIETEILKDPTKVGRTPMIPHNPPVSPLTFPQVDEKPATNPDQPVKVNFQPEAKPTPLIPPLPPATPFTSSSAFPSNPTPPPPIIPTPPTPIPPPAPTTTSSTPITPPPAPTTPMPIPMTNIPIAVKSNNTNNPAPTGATIDMIPGSENAGSPPVSSVSQDDKPGPAQYSGDQSDKIDDMEI